MMRGNLIPNNEGSLIENHALFPDRCNVEFASINDDGSITMRVWERGVGITQACGSGACAVFAAAKKSGRITSNQATIHLDGGAVTITWEADDKTHHSKRRGALSLSRGMAGLVTLPNLQS